MKARSFRHERAHALAATPRPSCEADVDAQLLAHGIGATGTPERAVAIMKGDHGLLCWSSAKIATPAAARLALPGRFPATCQNVGGGLHQEDTNA